MDFAAKAIRMGIEVNVKQRIGRRSFLGKAAAAAALPLAAREAAPASPPASAKRIAIEEHWTSRDIAALQKPRAWLKETRLGTTPGRVQRISDLGELRLSDMDQSGIAMQVIGGTSVQALTDTARAVELAKKSNDEQAALIEKHRNRFAGFASIATQDPKAAADELERAVQKLGFKGAMVGGRANGEFLDLDKYRVLWERAAALEAPIYIHPADPTPDIMNMYDSRPVLYGNTWAWGVETATHALRVIASGVFDAYPKAQIILGHLGESLPCLLGRFDEGLSSVQPASKGIKKVFSAYIKENILVTTSGWYQPEALVCAISALGADRILFATDYPWVDASLAIRMFEQTPMSAADREKIYHGNAERWLKA